MDPASRERSCPDLETLERLLRGEADPAVAAHAERCGACRERVASMRRDDAFIAHLAGASAGAGSRRELREEFPGYELEALLDFGGQGAVYRARETATGRSVAIKIPFGDPIRSPAKRYRFMRELELSSRLEHPAIVRTLGACEGRGGRLGCVMELVDGESFDDWMAARRREPNGVRAIVEALLAIADAIVFAHQRAVLHRDLKPANVLFDREGRPMILDFGLAKALDQEGSFATVTGAFVGTLACAAPERVAGAEDGPDVRTDVYGLGLLLYAGLAGRLPWSAELAPAALARAIREEMPERPSSLGVGDRELDAIVLKALAKEPSRRYASAEAFASDLRRRLAGAPIEARFDSRWYVLRKRLVHHRRVVAGGALALAALAVLGASALSARAARNRAELASAVRDARSVESHVAAVARARAIARDHHAAGESLLFTALLDPDPALVAAGDEGIAALGADSTSLPTSPALWGLWECAMRLRIVASCPRSLGRSASFVGADTVVGCDGPSIVGWDWRTAGIERRAATPMPVVDVVRDVRGGSGWLLFGREEIGDGGATLVDTGSGAAFDLGRGVVRVAACGEGAILIVRRVDAAAWRLERRGLPAREPSHVGPLLDWLPLEIASDGSVVLAMRAEGSLAAWRAADDGSFAALAVDAAPPLRWLASCGVPGEFIGGAFAGPVLLRDAADRVRVDSVADPGTLALVVPGLVEPASRGGRFVGFTDRRQVLVGEAASPFASVRLLPGVFATSVRLSPDGRHLLVFFDPDDRAAIVDLEPTVIRRLDQRGDLAPGASTTVFDLRFSEDGRSLLAASMDGSVHAHDMVRNDAAPATRRTIVSPRPDAGIARLALRGDELLLGLHDVGRDDAPLRIVRDGIVAPTGFAGTRWICGLVASHDAIWTLCGDGRVARLSAEGARVEVERVLPRHRERPGPRRLARIVERGLLLAGPSDAGLCLLDERTLEPRGPSIAMPAFHDIVASPADPDLLAVALDDGAIALLRIVASPSGELGCERVRTLRSHAGAVFGVAFHPSGSILASVGGVPESGDVRLWDVATGRELAALDLFALGGFAASFSPDGRWLAVGGEADPARPEEGGQLFLLDLEEPMRSIAGSLDYHVARLGRELGRPPRLEREVRAWFADRCRESP